jgi:hypothetical protein
MDEDWELVPHKILAELRDEVQQLKEKLSQPSMKQDVAAAMNELHKSLIDMQAIFKTALEQVNNPDMDIVQRLSALEKQNEQILRVISSGDKNERSAPAPVFAPDLDAMSPMQSPMPFAHSSLSPPRMQPMAPMPSMQMPPSRSQRIAPPPLRAPRMMPEPPSFSGGLPPPPPAPQKKGLFGFRKK